MAYAMSDVGVGIIPPFGSPSPRCVLAGGFFSCLSATFKRFSFSLSRYLAV